MMIMMGDQISFINSLISIIQHQTLNKYPFPTFSNYYYALLNASPPLQQLRGSYAAIRPARHNLKPFIFVLDPINAQSLAVVRLHGAQRQGRPTVPHTHHTRIVTRPEHVLGPRLPTNLHKPQHIKSHFSKFQTFKKVKLKIKPAKSRRKKNHPWLRG